MSNEIDWEKRALELIGEVVKTRGLVGTGWARKEMWEEAAVSWALQLGREMSDALAEEIGRACGHRSECCYAAGQTERAMIWDAARDVARSTISKPKTREQALEEALREVVSVAAVASVPSTGDRLLRDVTAIARRALDWKP